MVARVKVREGENLPVITTCPVSNDSPKDGRASPVGHLRARVHHAEAFDLESARAKYIYSGLVISVKVRGAVCATPASIRR